MTDSPHHVAPGLRDGLLLELSLAVGRSLDLEDCCTAFLESIRSRLRLQAASAWVHQSSLTPPEDGVTPPNEDLVLVGCAPRSARRERQIPGDHPAVRSVSQLPWALAEAGTEEAALLLSESVAEPGAIAVFRLGTTGLLKLLTSHESPPLGAQELDTLSQVVDKLAVAIQGCLAHEGLVVESIRRQQAEHALTLRERHFRALIERSLDIVAVIDSNGRLLEANAALSGVLGCAPEDLEGNDIRDLLVPEDRLIATEAFMWLRSGGPPTRPIRVAARHQLGGIVPLEVTLQDLRDDEAVGGIVLTARDLSDRVETEGRLRRSEALHRATVDSSLDAIVTIDHDGAIVEFNPAAQRLFGMPRTQALGRRIAETLVPEGWREAHCRGMEHYLATGEGPVLGQRIEVSALRADGSEFPIELVVVPIAADAGQLFTGFIRDLSGPKDAAIELAERGARLRAILETAVDGILTIDDTGRIESVNHAGATMFGFSPAELIGRDVAVLMPAPDSAMHDRHLAQYLESGVRHVIGTRREVLALHRNGATFPVALAVSEVEIEGRRLFTGILTDVTEQRRAEQELRETMLRLSTLIASLQAAVVVEDEHRRVVLVNDSYCEMFGVDRPPMALVGADCRVLTMEAAAVFVDPDRFLARIDELLEAQCVVTEEELELADGRVVERDCVPIFFGSDSRGHLWMYRDVTERRRATAELAEARRRELDIGGRIQQTLLLGPSPGRLRALSIVVHTVPSAGVDGDFYDVFIHSETVVDVVLGDVMGKGVPAALVAAATKSRLLRGLSLRWPSDRPGLTEPATLITRVAVDLVPQLIELERFVTLCYGRIDVLRQRLVLVDCGHTRTVHWHAATGAIDLVKGDNVPLGFLDCETYSQIVIEFQPGDLLLFYSDGVTEATDPSGDLFGESRLVEVVEATAAQGPQACVDAILGAVDEFTAGEAAGDDLSLLAVEIHEPRCLFSHRLEANLDALPRVRGLVREACGHMCEPPLPGDWVDQLLLAVNEAFTNVVRHAYADRENGPVEIDVELTRDAIVVEVHHWGAPLQRDSVPAPTFDGSRDGGFGIFLIERSVDSTEWLQREDGGSTLRMRKLTRRS